MKNALLTAKNVTKSFDGKSDVLCGVNIEVFEGDFTVIMGSSGSGKSTLLYALSGMDVVSGGQVIYRGEDITRYREPDMAALRADDFGFVFQKTHLVSNLTLYENIVLAGYISRKLTITKDEVREKAELLMARMNLSSARDRLPSAVSGGEAQRAAIARAVISGPRIIFADEPTGALNRANTVEVLNLFTSLHAAGQSILLVTHDKEAAIRGNRILYLEDGVITGELELGTYTEACGNMARDERLSGWLAEYKW